MMPTSKTQNPNSQDSGRILILSMGFGLLAIALVLTLASVTTVHLDRQELQNAADLCALAASDALDDDAYFTDDKALSQAQGAVNLTETSVRQAVLLRLENQPIRPGQEIRMCDPTGTNEANRATVTLCTISHPAALTWLPGTWGDGIEISATSTALSTIR